MAISHLRITAGEAAGRPVEPAEPPPEARDGERARAYLDLWERHLAMVAREGPVRR